MSAPEDLPYFHVVSKKEADGNVTTVVMMPTDVHASETCKLRQLRMVMPVVSSWSARALRTDW